jgi:hypothetical protein
MTLGTDPKEATRGEFLAGALRPIRLITGQADTKGSWLRRLDAVAGKSPCTPLCRWNQRLWP